MNKIKVTNIAASPQVSELKAPISLRIDFNTLEPVAEI